MNVVFDVGNTLTKAGVFAGGELIEIRNFPTKDFLDAKNTGVIAETIAGCKPDSVILSCVAGIPSTHFSGFQNTRFIELDHLTGLPFTNAYNTRETLGYDRLAAAAGAIFLLPGSDILVIDAGTCITFELVTKDNTYHGGAISPGINMRYRSLNSMTGRLPLLEAIDQAPLTGKTTEESIHSGVLNGILAEVMGVINAYQERFPGIMIIGTGGDWKYFDKNLKSHIFASPNLVLIGLNFILDYNAKKT